MIAMFRPMRLAGSGPPLKASTRLKLIQVAQKNSIATISVQIAAAIAIVFAIDAQMRPAYQAWLALLIVVSVARLAIDRVMARAIRRDPSRLPTRLAAVHSAGLIIGASLWAFLACWRFPLDGTEHRYLIALVLSSLSGGAIGILAPLKWTGRAYVSIMLLPACASLALLGGTDFLLGCVGTVFWVVMLTGHANNHAVVVSSITLSEENLELAAVVARQNQQLEDRVRQRTRDLQTMTRKAESANEAKSQFLATISHELRTPLNAISGASQLLGQTANTPALVETARILGSSTRMLRALVDDVLDVSRIESGSLTLQSADFSLTDLARDVADLYGQTASAKGLSLGIALDPACPPLRHGDPVRVMQIVCNLVSNALKMTDVGRVDLTVSGDAAGLLITVTDTGPGIAAADQARIFDRFVQADGSNTRAVGGAGLGLSICRDLAALMGGDIKVRSRTGRGAAFSVTLPLPEAAGISAAPTVETLPSPEAARVLVVDDNPINRKILQALLEHLGVTSVIAEDGQQAVAAWREGHWDAILMDVHMPVMDGVEATRTIRALELDQARHKTPIIAVTASVLTHETARYAEAGMDDLIPKPIDLAFLAQALNTHLSEAGKAA